jgi:hypothetical protein
MSLLSDLRAVKSAYSGDSNALAAVNDTISIIEKHFSLILGKRKRNATTQPGTVPRP